MRKTVLFNSKRLDVRELSEEHFALFTELVSDPEIIKPVPQQPLEAEEIREKFEVLTQYDVNPPDSGKNVWGIFETNQTELIGLLALLKNDENQPEIGYRLRTSFWGKGYATEVTKALIDFCFNDLHLELVTGDVNVENPASVAILAKFMKPVKEFNNEKDNCIDRRYEVWAKDWITT